MPTSRTGKEYHRGVLHAPYLIVIASSPPATPIAHANDVAVLLVATLCVYIRDDAGGTPAHHAAYYGKIEALKWLLQSSTDRRGIAHAAASDGGTPLHFAAARGHLDCLILLSCDEVGGDAECVDSKGATPLYFAAQEGHLLVLQWLLLKAHVNPIRQAADGMCAAHAASVSSPPLINQLIHCYMVARSAVIVVYAAPALDGESVVSHLQPLSAGLKQVGLSVCGSSCRCLVLPPLL